MAVNYRLIVRHAGFEGRGNTENLSERGAMLSVDIDPALNAGDMLELDLELPQGGGAITVRVTVPKKLTAEQEDKLRELAKELGLDVAAKKKGLLNSLLGR